MSQSTISYLLSSNTLFIGVCSLMVNMGARYVINDITEAQDYFFRQPIIKAFVLFCMCFLATRDLRTSIVLTVSFFLASNALLNENSQFNIIPIFIQKKIEQYKKSKTKI